MFSTFLVSNTDDAGPGSLRQAILDAGAASGSAVIDFAIPGDGAHTIAPSSPLPAITKGVLIDGFSQPGYDGTPLIELSGGQAGTGDGLYVTGSGVTIRGLVINGFSEGAGIRITGTGATGNRIYGNFLGTDPTGTQAVPNTFGLTIEAGATSNLVGTDGDGVNDASEWNLLSGNLPIGVAIIGLDTNGNSISGNLIGTDITGTVPLGNAYSGVWISGGGADNTIGGTASLSGNLIAFNTGPGVVVADDDSLGNRINANRIFANFGPAIDLGDDGITDNASSPRNGPNRLQNDPVVVRRADGRLEGWLGASTPNTTFRVEVFASAGFGSGGAGEAHDYLGSLDVTTDSRGQVVFDVPYQPPTDLPVITATATDPQGNTSEVSPAIRLELQTPTDVVRLLHGQSSIFSISSGSAILLSHGDAGPLDPGSMMTLTVTAGMLTLGQTNSLVGSGNGTGTLQYRGTISALNAALASMTYAVPADFHGNSTLRIDVVPMSPGGAPCHAEISITDGTFVVTNTSDAGPGSLRQAIFDSNTTPGATNTIEFTIPGAGIHTINTTSPLPPVTTPAVIDGWSQPGFAGTALIVVARSSLVDDSPLTIRDASVAVRGLTLGGVAGPLVDDYRIETTTTERLTAIVHAVGSGTRLSLRDAQGRVLMQSDGQSASNLDNRIEIHLPAGSFVLEVEQRQGPGTYTLTSTLTAATTPFEPIPSYFTTPSSSVAGDISDVSDFINLRVPDSLVRGDFNGDGRLDIATVNSSGFTFNDVSVLLGNGDGTFQQAKSSHVEFPAHPDEAVHNLAILQVMVSGDFDSDGHLDLAVTSAAADDLAVMLGNGDGTFSQPRIYSVGVRGDCLVLGDVNGDEHLDLLVAQRNASTVSILLGSPDGSFSQRFSLATGSPVQSLVAGDFDGDGHLDLATADRVGSPGTELEFAL